MWLIVLLALAIVFIVVATSHFKMHPFLALLLAAFGFGILAGMPLMDVVNSVNKGFGGTIGYIGIVIVAGTIIGIFLEKSGGAFKLAESALKVTGEKNVPLAMGIVGYIVSMPVFCDSGFVILSPLNKALAKKAKTTLAVGAVALSLGLYATHTMVPPTPGPVAAAGFLEADLGLVIMWGVIVSAIALAAGWLFAITYAAKEHIEPYPEDEEGVDHTPVVSEKDAPSAGKSLIPILLPLILIVAASIVKFMFKPVEGVDPEGWYKVVMFFGQPVVALIIGVLLSFLLPKKLEATMLSGKGWLGEAIVAASTIIIITGAGGSFGKVLQNSGIANVIGDRLADLQSVGIWLPFIIAAALKTAQGSSTVAIITTAGIMSSMLGPLGYESPNARALIVVAIGAGAMVVSHANDSYFWVVTQFSNMDVRQGYKLQTLGTLIEGVTAAIAVWVISMIVL